jgi:hypothetical protein
VRGVLVEKLAYGKRRSGAADHRAAKKETQNRNIDLICPLFTPVYFC